MSRPPGVNPSLINVIIDALVVMRRDEGITLLIVEHNMRAVSELCEKVWALAAGKVIAEAHAGGDLNARGGHYLLPRPRPHGGRVTALLKTSGLHCGYGADEIIHGVDLEVVRGEIVTILGPNGCGKTTLVGRSSATYASTGGVDPLPRRGSQWDAADRAGRAEFATPQRPNTGPLTITENLETGYRLRRPERNAAIGRMFALFPPLAERRGQRAATLSGGERQLLAMARALIVSPALIFLDEPSWAKPLRADEVFRHVRVIAATGVAVVIVEQDASCAGGLGPRFHVLVTGRVALHGPATTIAAADERIRSAYLGVRGTPPLGGAIRLNERKGN